MSPHEYVRQFGMYWPIINRQAPSGASAPKPVGVRK
jgi:hypothetical protein